MQQLGTVEFGTLQLEQARLALGEALGQIQDLPEQSAEISRIGRSIASALQHIFYTQNATLLETQIHQGLHQAIEHLRETLGMVCGDEWGDPTIDLVTATVSLSLSDLSSAAGRLDHRRRRRSVTAGARSSSPRLESIPIGAVRLVKKQIPRPCRTARSTVPPALN